MTIRPGVLVVGAGGHALVSIEVLQASGRTVVGCVATGGRASASLEPLGVEVLGDAENLEDFVRNGLDHVFVAVGDNRTREALTARAQACGATLVTAVSPASMISPTATVGPGALVMPGAVLTSQASIGAGAIINSAAVVEHECSIGSFAHIAPGAALAGRVTVGRGALVGIGATVLPGRRIGDSAVVGAGAVVIDDVADHATVVGVPARPVDKQP